MMCKKFGRMQTLICQKRSKPIALKKNRRKLPFIALTEKSQTTVPHGGFLLKEGTILMGIDPGTAVTGWAILEFTHRGAKFIEAGTIRTNAKDEFPIRLKNLADGIALIIEKYHPTVSALEEPYFGENAQAALTLGQARGALILTIAQNGIPVFSYTPKEVKRAVVGNGSATKEQVAFMVRRLLNLVEPTELPNDATDALAVAYCHSLRCRLIPC